MTNLLHVDCFFRSLAHCTGISSAQSTKHCSSVRGCQQPLQPNDKRDVQQFQAHTNNIAATEQSHPVDETPNALQKP
eukprot:38430-Amphidinium_carterae.2